MTDPTIDLLTDLRTVDLDEIDEMFPTAHRVAQLQDILDRVAADQSGTHRPAHAASPTARTLRPRWRRSATRRRPLVLSALGGVVAVAIAAAVLFTGSAAVHPTPAVAFTTAASGDIVATVTDPFAAQKQLDAAFAAHGFDITVKLVPVSPSLVGTLVGMGAGAGGSLSEIKPIEGNGPCVEGGAGCPIGVEIPATFTGSGSIILGRPAQPGEQYAAAGSAFAPGEALHCSGLIDAQVATASPILAADGINVTWTAPTGSGGETVVTTTPSAQNYIWNATPIAPNQIRLQTEPTLPSAAFDAQNARYNQGCPATTAPTPATGPTSPTTDGATLGTTT